MWFLHFSILGSRASVDVSHKVSHPFDWTFTTNYSGTVFGAATVEPTDLRIDMEKLKLKEQILFFDEIHLYEDELADHGCASCSIKVVTSQKKKISDNVSRNPDALTWLYLNCFIGKRAMPSGFFVLNRFYLRVDDVLIRINDTRLYYEKGKDYILREYTSRQSKTKDLKVRLSLW